MTTTSTRRISLIAAALALAIGACAGSNGAHDKDETAQAKSPDDLPLPLWPQITHGTLSNGLSYSILKHDKPEKRAFMWLAVNAGSVQEDDDQRGLAHLDEHMAFDGTKHFKKSAIIDYIEKIGMRFGADLNAYTNFDQTVYQLEVPTDNAQFLGTGLDILRDWAGDVSYEPEEVERERGVVLEEWRLGRGSSQRIFDKQAKVLFKGSRYADRLTIGLPEIIKSAPRETLYRFYQDYYRPDLMAVIVVGDVDAKWVEAQIVKRFADLKAPPNERPRVSGGLPVADGTRVTIETDPEEPSTWVNIYNLLPHRPDSSANDFRRSLVEQLYSTMLSERFNTLSHQPGAPFRRAYGGITNFTREVDAFARAGEVKGGKVEETLRALFTETLRVETRGFTQSELLRARAILQRSFDEGLAREATENSRSLMAELVRNFVSAEFVIGRRAEDDFVTRVLPTIGIDEINQAGARFGGDKNRVIAISGPDSAKLPDEPTVRAIVAEVSASKLEPWADEAPAPLMPKLPVPGKIVSETKLDAAHGSLTEWTLSNGVRVVLKPTDYEADSVIVHGFSPGGISLVSDSDFNTARFADGAVQAGGLGALDAVALGKALAGKSVFANVSLNEIDQSVEGGGSAKDIETILQLINLRMTAPRKDPAAFAVWKANIEEQIQEQERVPEYQLAKKSNEVLYAGNPRRMFPTAKDVDAIDLDKSLELYRGRYGDASGFTFVVVGSIDLAALKPLVETYLASLPASGRKESERDLQIRQVPGVVEREWRLGEAPKASVELRFHGDEAWSRDKERDVAILGRVLSIRLREVLRSGLGGVYGVGAGGSIDRSPHQERSFLVRFGCDPNNVDKLLEATRKEIAAVKDHGASEELLGKVRETYLRERETELRENRYWMSRLVNVYRYGDDPALILDSASTVARMTSANVAAAAKLWLDDSQILRVIRLPEASAKPAAPAQETHSK